MIIKKFQAKTENEAVELAKKELGNNVVVMNVRSVKRKGLFSFLKPQLVEITVALEEESEKREVHTAAPDARSITEALGKIAPIVEKAEAQKREGTMSKKEDSDADKVIAERLNNLENLIEEKLQKPEEEKAKEKEASEEEKQENDELKCFFELLHKTMTDNEVNEEYASSIIEETAKITKPGTPFDVALAGIYQKMILVKIINLLEK